MAQGFDSSEVPGPQSQEAIEETSSGSERSILEKDAMVLGKRGQNPIHASETAAPEGTILTK